MTIRNLTPHTITIYAEDGKTVLATFAPDGLVARASQAVQPAGEENGIKLVRMTFGEPVDLPDPEPGVLLIVSGITAQAAQAAGRDCSDLRLPALPVRNEAGQIIGSQAFALV